MSAEYPFKFDREKAKEAILYIASRAPKPDRFHICKILYFADKYHLENYARFLYGDIYTAMKHGPVPSCAYDIIKAADTGAIADIAVNDWDVAALREPELDTFSESDLEALDWAIAEYGSLEFLELRAKSHDEAWKAATENGALIEPPSIVRSVPIPFESIVSLLKDKDAILDYIQEYY